MGLEMCEWVSLKPEWLDGKAADWLGSGRGLCPPRLTIAQPGQNHCSASWLPLPWNEVISSASQRIRASLVISIGIGRLIALHKPN